MIFTTITFLISFILEIILPNIFTGYILFFTITSVYFYAGNRKALILIGVLYDLFFTKMLILHSLIFIVVNIISKKFLNKGAVLNVVVYIITIFLYTLIISFYKLVYSNFDRTLFVFFIHSLAINIIYFLIIYVINYFVGNRKIILSYF